MAACWNMTWFAFETRFCTHKQDSQYLQIVIHSPMKEVSHGAF